MRDASTEDAKFQVTHAGPDAIDGLAALIRVAEQGRAFVLSDPHGGGAARAHVERALAEARMNARFVEISVNPLRTGHAREIAALFADFSGGALVTAGGSQLIAVGKAVAALATNPWWRPGDSLRVAPRTHIAVVEGLGLAEESTSLVAIDPRVPHVVDDDRVSALSVIDDRLFPDTDPTVPQYKLLAVALAACTVTDETASLRERTLALTAVHHLARPDSRPAEVRHALALATAGHSRWPLCRRCRAGTELPAATFDGTARSPAHLCLQQAVARGLTVATA
jgi:hypothetical protein